MLIGAHLSTAGGVLKPLESIVEKGGNALQIFSASPRMWSSPTFTPEMMGNFIERKKELGIDPIYFHASYLINLADPEITGARSKKTLIAELTAASQMQIRGSIVHTGSFKKNKTPEGYQVLLKNIREVLENTPADTLFILENSAGDKIGQKLEELGSIISDIGSARLRVCLDTCHLHAAGYDLATSAKLTEFLKEFEKHIGLMRLEVFHLNDSRDEFGSSRDRHENIGEGKVGTETLKNVINHPKLCNLPFILEVPGANGQGPDKENLERVKGLVS